MKIMLSVIILILTLTSTLTAQSRDEKQVAAAVQQLRQAIIDANRQQLEDIASEKLSYGHSNGKIEGKSAFIEAFVSGASDFLTMDLTGQTITIAGKTALVRHNLTGNVKDNGIPNTVNLGVLLVWQKENRKWKLLARQAFKLLPAPTP